MLDWRVARGALALVPVRADGPRLRSAPPRRRPRLALLGLGSHSFEVLRVCVCAASRCAEEIDLKQSLAKNEHRPSAPRTTRHTYSLSHQSHATATPPPGNTTRVQRARLRVRVTVTRPTRRCPRPLSPRASHVLRRRTQGLARRARGAEAAAAGARCACACACASRARVHAGLATVRRSRSCATAAPASAVDEQVSAPARPSFEMERKTPTTMRLSGMPKRFMMTPR